MYRTIWITWRPELPPAAIRAGIDSIGASFAKRYGFTHNWEGTRLCRVRGMGIEGSIKLSGKDLVVEFRIPFTYFSWERTIRTGVREALGKHVGGKLVSEE